MENLACGGARLKSGNDGETVFITGGSGFIGRALVAQCLGHGCSVVVYDNLRVGSLATLAPFLDSVTFVEGDVRDEGAVCRAMDACKPNRVIHLAALHFIPYCNAHPIETMDVNVSGTYSVLAASALHEVESVVFASSGALYASETHPLNEERDVPAPVDVYGVSKLLGERICEHFASTAGLSCRIARLFNTYGPYETNPHLLPEIVSQLKTGAALELGNLEAKRDYIFVEDTAAALDTLSRIRESGFDIYNVGMGREYSARELLEAIGQAMGRSLVVHQSPSRMRGIDKMHQIADISRLRDGTGFVATIGIAEGLGRLLAAEGII